VLVLGSLLAGTLSWPAVAAEPSLEALVQSSNIPYEGLLVINGRTIVRVLHGAGDRRRQEFVAPPRMKGDLIVDNGMTLWHFSPRTQKVELSPTRQWAERVPDRLRLLTRNYRMKLLGSEKVAGRPAYVVDLQSTHPNRPSQRLWLDQTHAVPLRIERRGVGGILLERSEFSEIAFPEAVDSSQFQLALPHNAAVTTSVKVLASGRKLADLREPLPFPARLPDYLPGGFEALDVHLFESKGVKSLHCRLSDGLTTLSLFMTDKAHHPDLADARAVDLAPNRKAHVLEQSGRRMLCWSGDRTGYAMIGELSADELLKVARSSLVDE
jgi:sigma-E factor negative regulatory protein RseB